MKYLKYILGIIFLLLTVQLFAQSDGSINQKDAQGNKFGKWQGRYPGGQLRYLGQFNANQPVDTFVYYYQNGDLKTVLIYEGEEGNKAYARHYYQTGEKMAEGWYFEQKKDSLWRTYGAGERVLTEGAYYQGEKYGLWRTYFDNGRLAEEVYFKDDYEHGPLKVYHDNGKLKQEANFENGFLNGLSTHYDAQGKKTLKGIYYKGSRDKNWIYYENQEVKRVLKYDKGVLLNPEAIKGLDADSLMNSVKNNVKDNLEFEDLRGRIKYD